MPSGVNDTVANAVLDKVLGSGAATGILGTTIYLDLLTTEATDDNGTSAVSWGQGRTSVSVTSGTIWPAASGRLKTSTPITSATNASGSTITVVAFAWYTASTAGTYLGGGPLSDASVDVANGTAVTVTATLASPSPS